MTADPKIRYAFGSEVAMQQHRQAMGDKATKDIPVAFADDTKNIAELKKAQAKTGIFNADAGIVDSKGTVSGYMFKDQKEIDAYLKRTTVQETTTPVAAPKSVAQQNMDTIAVGDKAFNDEISSLSLGDLTERNDNHYSEKTATLFLEREAAESTTEKKRIQSILSRYSGALDMRKKNVPNPLESEKNFARTMRNIEEKK
ncbi:hypothetical protein AUK10_03445 [Candidatus Gracilibacteria bacterium CG2_30_37_12]|nr:MAG: hypothetical protein AUK10_03445 [Candidatus Gracilibacteria bacterium CG2_30_37_12]